jgi:hypothetical protein
VRKNEVTSSCVIGDKECYLCVLRHTMKLLRQLQLWRLPVVLVERPVGNKFRLSAGLQFLWREEDRLRTNQFSFHQRKK